MMTRQKISMADCHHEAPAESLYCTREEGHRGYHRNGDLAWDVGGSFIVSKRSVKAGWGPGAWEAMLEPAAPKDLDINKLLPGTAFKNFRPDGSYRKVVGPDEGDWVD